jgi:hypothetical protein
VSSWLAANWPALVISAGSLFVNALAFVVTIRWHCKNDDRKFGAMEERSERHEKRLASLEGRRR